MTTTNIGHVVANSLLMVANLLSHQSATKVTKVTVPELTQTNSSALILDCEFSVPDENFVLQWLFNGERPPVYEWRPNTEPVVVDLLRDRLDVQYKAADSPAVGRRSLRILRPGPELSGDYTCLVRSDAGAEDHATKTVLVFSPEHEFVLAIDYAEEFEVNCIARGLYPQPTLVLERNREQIPKQEQRIWRNGSSYDARGRAALAPSSLRDGDRLACRLLLPPAGYSAVREQVFRWGALVLCLELNFI
ncbi:hypothetical protein JYU34_008862 [Plutella xylostella]|uniref:Ig-like domain-containing protein n=1 Tax=Plutella xylostella TaxID=51655 RepID=A0ABQ7QM08_PLUXY|nr:hypothetical protein JYU34_008862 [Plutella xylostella]